jgi:predicted phosphoribosyltransferase
MRFHDRASAGRQLGELILRRRHPYTDPIVLGLPRGGLPVAAAVASALDAPIDVLVVRKLGVPGHEEYAMGAIASGGAMVLDRDVTRRLGITDDDIDRVTRREKAELERREAAYRGGRAPLDVAGRTVIVVDDGIATGSTMRAAVLAIRSLDPAAVIVATPVAPPDTVALLSDVADDVIVVAQPTPFLAVGYWYDDFAQTSDAEVISILETSSDG